MTAKSSPESLDLVLRQLRADDISFASEVRALAGWNQTGNDWRGYLRFDPQGCFLGEVNGAPAGTATTLHYGCAVGWIGMVLVHPSFRRMGVGTALLQRTIEYLTELGIGCIKLDATSMGRAVYLPLGFKDEYEVVRYQGIVPMESSKGEEPRRLKPDVIPALGTFDAAAFGVDRTFVLADLSQRNPEYCFYVSTAERVCGYVIAREGERAVQIGPFVAENPVAADSLLLACFHQVRGCPAFIDVPVPNEAARRLVESRGFTEQRRYTRMFLGDNTCPGDPTRVFGTSGAEKG